MLNAGDGRALIKGGEQQEIFARFSQLNAELLGVQNALQQEYQRAEQSGDRKTLELLSLQFENAIKDARRQENELLRQYADSYAAAYVVASSANQLDLEALRARFALLGEAAKKTIPGLFVQTQLAELESLVEGGKAPDFSVLSPGRDSLSLYSLKGKLKLLVFWDSKDSKCRQENVNILDIYQKYHLKGLEIISISSEQDRKAWMQAINQDAMLWHQGLDVNSAVFNRYHVHAVPYTILLDGENNIIAKELEGVALKKKIAELLKRK